MSNDYEFKAWSPPELDIRVETPDGVSYNEGNRIYNNLQDGTGHPVIQSGDWQVLPQRHKPSPGKITT